VRAPTDTQTDTSLFSLQQLLLLLLQDREIKEQENLSHKQNPTEKSLTKNRFTKETRQKREQKTNRQIQKFRIQGRQNKNLSLKNKALREEQSNKTRRENQKNKKQKAL
jgi:hypothetical protein